MKLHIAIPALNEEASIESTILRCLDARAYITSHAPVSDVEIKVVSDGSSDRTVELAQRYEDQIRLIVFQRNRGYGAAIKESWSHSDADLLAFMDADGTCDPRFFANLCKMLEQTGADVVLGGRLNSESKMPLVRRVGNTIFAILLSTLARTAVRDTASGMRVVRRAALTRLLPLPDGLHFTPAMTARALMSGDVSIAEVDMPYEEREGESKLRVGKDGVRFLKVILDMAFLYEPWRPLLLVGVLSFAVAAGLMLTPIIHYARHRSLQEWMIYRFIVGHLAGTNAFLMFSAAYVAGRAAQIALNRDAEPGFFRRLLNRPQFSLIPVLLMIAGGLLVLPSFVELVRTGSIYEHWSRFIAMSFLFSTALILLATWAVHYVLELLAYQLRYLRDLGGTSPESVSAANRIAQSSAELPGKVYLP